MDGAESSEIETDNIESEVHWLSGVFYKSAYIVVLLSWIQSLTASYIGHSFLALLGENDYDDLIVDDNTTSYIDDIDSTLSTHPAHRLEMRDVVTCLLLVTLCLKVWPGSVQTSDTLYHAGSVVQRRNRVAQTTGPFLKRFRQGQRHLADVSSKLQCEKGTITRRWKRVFSKYMIAERMLLCDIRSKEKLIGFLRAKIQCSLAGLKEVTSLVKVSRDKLEVQRVENKTIIDQLEYFAQIGQMRQ